MAYLEISFCLFKVFFKGTKQGAVLNGQNILLGDVSTGVPQGSILGHLFFLVYLNDLAADVKCNVKLFLMIQNILTHLPVIRATT